MRVLVDCDPPLLGEVVSLALARIDGVELTCLDHSTPADLAVLSGKAGRNVYDAAARTVILDAATDLPRLVADVRAWLSQAAEAGNSPCSPNRGHLKIRKNQGSR